MSQTRENGQVEASDFNSRSSHFGSSFVFNGEVTGKENLVISGHFQGKLELIDHDLIIESNAKVEAEIKLRNITVRGTLSGNISAAGRVSIEKSARMDGDISAASVSISEGAKFKGSVKMISPQPGLPLSR